MVNFLLAVAHCHACPPPPPGAVNQLLLVYGIFFGIIAIIGLCFAHWESKMKKYSKWQCPSCFRWVEEEMAKVCKTCTNRGFD